MYLNSFPLVKLMGKRRQKLKIALVMPNHAKMHSSLANYIKTYRYLISKGLIELTLLTDQRNSIALKGIQIKKIAGYDYGTFFSKVLFALGVPRFYYKNLDEELKGYDVVVSNNPEFYAYAYQAYKAARKNNARFILRTSQTVDGFFLYRLTRFVVNPLIKGAYEGASHLIFSNPQAMERCVRLGLISKKENKIISGHAIDDVEFRPLKVKKPLFPMLLSVGGLYRLKGHQYIIEALVRVREQHPDAQVWIVGSGPYLDDLQLLARKLGVEKNVRFLGDRNHKSLAKLYNQCSVFVLANEQEITPAVNEALACEVPVVVMECGGRPFVIPNESYGLIARKKDAMNLAEKILCALDNKKLAERIARKGRRRVLERFTIPVVASKFYKAFAR